jgi:multisubunit Na+/H+ antiporter MnhB subunit
MAAEATTAAAGSAEYGLPAYPGTPVLVRVKKGEQAEYSPGQIVELRRGGLASQTAAALLPPVAGFVLGYALAGLPAPDSGVQAGAGLILMFALALGFYLFRRRRQPRLFFTIRRPALKT